MWPVALSRMKLSGKLQPQEASPGNYMGKGEGGQGPISLRSSPSGQETWYLIDILLSLPD